MNRFTARQPIFDISGNVFAYELLYREGQENRFPVGMNSTQATSQILVNTFLDANIEKIANNKPVFINFDEKSLKENFVSAAPSNRVILEILETVSPSLEMLNIIKKLHAEGYRLAMDDFIYSPEWDKFLPYIAYIKIDIQDQSLDKVALLMDKLKSHGAKLLAEKVETYEEYSEAKRLGFSFFQGYYFCTPKVIKSSGLSVEEGKLMQVYVEVMNPDMCFERLNKYFQLNVSLSVKLLRYVNNTNTFKVKREITSIKQAIIMMGGELLKRFVCILITSELNNNKPAELVKVSTYRARFCEQLTKKTVFAEHSDRAFLVGLFSSVDALLDVKMETIMNSMPLDRDIKLALTQNVGLLSTILNVIRHFEKGQWSEIDSIVEQLNLNESLIRSIYEDAVLWADQNEASIAESNKSIAA